MPVRNAGVAGRSVVPVVRREDLTVGGLVGQEGELREQCAQHAGHDQLVPGAAEHGERPTRDAEQHGEHGDETPVPARAPAEEPAVRTCASSAVYVEVVSARGDRRSVFR